MLKNHEEFIEKQHQEEENSEFIMPTSKKSAPSYQSALQLCMAFTFVFVIFLTAKYSSVAIFDVKPEMIRHLAYHDSEVQVDKSRYDLFFTTYLVHTLSMYHITNDQSSIINR